VSEASLTREKWGAVLQDASPPTFGEIVATLQERDLVPGDPAALVEDAVDGDGPLVEDVDAAGAFAVYRLDEADTGDSSVSEGGERAHVDANPTPETDKTGSSHPDSRVNADSDVDGWGDAEFADPASGVWPEELLECEQWMGHVGKKPFAPWGDRDHPEADPDEDARWKWGLSENYVDGETVAMAEIDGRLDGRAFLQQPDDPYAYVDGDDVRDPETGEVHPAFLEILDRLGVTYADVSQSGAGAHAMYRGELPDGVKQAAWELDEEPWGENDDLPSIETYAGKRVCVATGEHIPGTPVEVCEWDGDALEDVLDENDQLPEHPVRGDEEGTSVDLEGYDPGATEATETTDDIRDIYHALDRLDARYVAERTIVQQWNGDASTSDGKRAFWPTWGSTSDRGTANVVDDRIWQDTGSRGGYGGPVVMALIDAGELSDRNVSPRDASGELWWKGVDHLRDLGFDIPEYVPSTPDTETDPEELKSLDVTLAPEVAWRAAEAVRPDELDVDVDVPTTADGASWECPRCGGEIDVVRMAAIDASIVRDCSAPLRDDGYDRAYEHARRGLEAPLPEYVNRETATERWDVVSGAIRQLDFWHLDEDAIESEVTGRGDDVDGEAQLTLSPAWRDSESGESVLVFPSGVVYEAHPDHEGALDVLRFVALDAGVVSWEEFTDEDYVLSGETFRDAYQTAREYGAPLPKWQGTDAYHTAVLPPVDALVEEDVGNDDRLTAAYDAVADLYREAAESGEASLLRVLPGLGKTEQVFQNATEYSVLYTAGRKELMQDGVQRAEENGASSFILPVFAENGLPNVVSDTAEAVVRENGQRLLRDRWSLVNRIKERLPDGEDLRKPEEYDGADEDGVILDRESCPVADGEYGLDWWVAVHAARARGYRPQQIHENAPALFGAELPCCEDESCPYTEAWEIATDPDAPIDVLIGHYTHAHVEGARTYSVRENGRTRKEPRAVAVDEFPGEAFQREFGEEFPDLAAWLAASLREDIDDRQDVLTKAGDLWNDETLREWLASDSTSDEHGRIENIVGAADAALGAVETAEWLLEESRDACSDLGVEGALERLVDAHPKFDAGVVTSVTAVISSALSDGDNRAGHTNTNGQLNDLVNQLREVQMAGASLDEDLEDALGDASHVDGALASLVDEAVDGFRERDESARRRLDAARTALKGGPDGCEALAMHADDGYAHPLAHALLYALLAPAEADDVSIVRTSNFTFGRDEETRLSSVSYRKSRVVIDRNHHGAVVNHPPALAAGGDENPTVGLDATGRDTLWELTLGRDVTTRDIHDSPRERREFLREVYGLQMVQTSPHANSYEGDPSGKNFDDDVELVNEVAEQYSDAVGESPAVLTTKVVEETLEERLDGVASTTGHYGDLKGSNALAPHRLAVLLGCQHYGDHVVERWAALAGEEATRTGHGMALDYNSRVANTALAHMREDQVMQAALRFGRDSDGALVFAHTAALRDDLPVVADGEVVRTFSEQAQAIARAAGDLTRQPRFTAADVRDRVDGFDPDPRSVRRVLSELAEFGYLEKTETPNGYANEFSVETEPGSAEVELPELDSRADESEPGRDPLEVYYTWSVRVSGGDPRAARHRTIGSAQLPAPGGGGQADQASAPRG